MPATPAIPSNTAFRLVPVRDQAYPASVRLVANSLLVFLAIVGLVLPKAGARAHEVPCDSPLACSSLAQTSSPDHSPCSGCPPPESCPCDHEHSPEQPQHDHQVPAVPADDHEPPPTDECPSQHQHQHHHQCLCLAANAWLISDHDALALHPPRLGGVLAVRDHHFRPESPVFLLERPPMA